jgi:uncharacterized protein YdhG (YjbR/CyaY superfamily)
MTTAAKSKQSKGFSDEERAAMKERAKEVTADKEGGESILLAKIAEMPEPDRTKATRVHKIIMESAPSLSPKTWYGMPAYADKDGKIVCFFQAASKFKYRYATLGFNEAAKLDEGHLWPIAYALTTLTPADETKIAALVKKAVG